VDTILTELLGWAGRGRSLTVLDMTISIIMLSLKGSIRPLWRQNCKTSSTNTSSIWYH